MHFEDLSDKELYQLENAIDADYDALVDVSARLCAEVRRHRAAVCAATEHVHQVVTQAILDVLGSERAEDDKMPTAEWLIKAIANRVADQLAVPTVAEPVGCPVHADQIHGGEAAELRAGIERVVADYADCEDTYGFKRRLQRLLDSVDARDSLAHTEQVGAVRAVGAVGAAEAAGAAGAAGAAKQALPVVGLSDKERERELLLDIRYAVTHTQRTGPASAESVWLPHLALLNRLLTSPAPSAGIVVDTGLPITFGGEE